MKKFFARLFLYLTLFTICGVAVAPRASGQTVSVEPTAIYRFTVSIWDGGALLTPFFEEGTANGYSFDHEILSTTGFGPLGMYVPPPGYQPDPAAGLVPLHRWTVIQDGWRTHYYYSTYYTEQPSDRYYNGIAGWVYPPGQTTTNNGLPLRSLSVFYSSDYGFWNGYSDYPNSYNVEFPPPIDPQKGGYQYQGLIAALPRATVDPHFPPLINPFPPPTAWAVQFHAPGTPPGGGGEGGGGGGGNSNSCNPSSGTVNACQHNGGWWDYDTCTCQY